MSLISFIIIIPILLFILVSIFIFLDIKKSPIISFMFSSIERLSINIGFTITPLFIASISTFLIFLFKTSFKKIKVPKVLLILLSLILFSTIISIFNSKFPFEATKSSIYILIYILIIIVQYLIITSFDNKSKIYFSISLSLLVFSIYSIFQYIRYRYNLYPDLFNINIPYNNSLSPLDFTINTGNGKILRPNSFFNDVNTSAGYITLFLPITIGFFAESFFRLRNNLNFKNTAYIIFLFVSIASSCLGLFLMSSRASSFSLALIVVFILLLFLLKTFNIRSFLLIVLSIFLLGTIYISVNYKYIDQSLRKIYNSEFSFQAHVNYINYSINLFKKNPISGSGVGTFYDYYLNDDSLSNKLPSVDNPPQFIKYLAEEGILGLISWLAMYMYMLIIGIRYVYNKGFSLDVYKNYSLVLAVIGLISGGFFHSYMNLFFVAIFIALYFSEFDIR